MRIVFFGSGEFGLPTLQHLALKHQIVGVISQPDRPAGRGRQPAPTPIAAWAVERGLPVTRCADANDTDTISLLTELHADAGVVIAFGQKLSPAVIARCGKGAFNLHASLLPHYRGAAPINWAIINGESETGVSVISLAQRMDAGLIYAQASTAINPMETAGELHDRLAALGPDVVEGVLDDLSHGKLAGKPQDENHASRAPKLKKEDSNISFQQTAAHFRQRVHGLTPWPGAHTTWTEDNSNRDQPLIIRRVRDRTDMTFNAPPGSVLDDGHRVAVLDGVIELLEVQAPGGRPMPIAEFLRGHPIKTGSRFINGKSVLP